MNEQMMKERIQQALNAQMSGVGTSPAERSELLENAIGGRKVKRKLTVGLVFAMVLVLMTAAAVAAILLTRKEIVEQVAVPLAVENDGELGVKSSYSAEELAELVRTLNENGITLEENSTIMQALKTGEEFYEEEAIMEICKQAFGGNLGTWTLEEQDWFNKMMADIGFCESYEPCLPGEDNMTYEQAEAYAFSAWEKEYGEDLHPEDRAIYQLERSFCHDSDADGMATWYFTLNPRDLDHGRYSIMFRDRDPKETTEVSKVLWDWNRPYTADELLAAFRMVYGTNQGRWEQPVWQKMHEMMANAEIDQEETYSCREYRGYQMTGYPEPAEGEITREEAIRIAGETMKDKHAAMESVLLTEYDGKRAWLVSFRIKAEYGCDSSVVTVDSRTGNAESIKEGAAPLMRYVPEAAYAKAGEGLMTWEDELNLAVNAVTKVHPELDLMNDNEYEIRTASIREIKINFITKNIHHGDVFVSVSRDGTLKELTVDEEELNGDNLFERYWKVYGYFGEWDQKTWVQLAKDMELLEPESLEGKLLKAGRYPEENAVSVGRTEAMKIAIKASGKRTAEINTCVLVGAEPHPVWKLRVMAYDDDDGADKVFEVDAETGEVLGSEPYKTDYTPHYVLFSLERNRRAMELKELGPVEIARREITYAFGDLSLDCPEPEFDEPDLYEIQTDGLTTRFIGRDPNMYNYEVELDENGYVLRCESSETASLMPTPLPDGRPWFWGQGIEDEAFWNRLEKVIEERGVAVDNYDRTEAKWIELYGDWDSWPEDCYIVNFLFEEGNEETLRNEQYPVFSSADKLPKEDIIQKGREALYKICEKAWTDNQKFVGRLWDNVKNPDTGEGYGKRVWIFSLEDKITGYIGGQQIWLDEDGNVLWSRVDGQFLNK